MNFPAMFHRFSARFRRIRALYGMIILDAGCMGSFAGCEIVGLAKYVVCRPAILLLNCSDFVRIRFIFCMVSVRAERRQSLEYAQARAMVRQDGCAINVMKTIL